MDLHRLSVLITKAEGKKIELSIAQVKEVLRCLGGILYKLDSDELATVLERLLKPSTSKAKRP